ncbi:glycosyltransferase family 4 protein [Bombilactobacillus thymidiniphilus]|uniref:Glycosyltransferase family 4 protein n=1 Tax=Bombilactobacillus thymidiniphilus TaxID=2923363 RepID=A0ABY4PEB3_9LACO|nr:glycosyltransferase family 4 protein [Bombilactobacillus thymidiniphilus]UQS84065.1 glycosyltransferase family 4 protein [Bombilactobacillus thymidiniphilus]
MINITMFSSAQKVAGQGVGSAYAELMSLLQDYLATDFDVQVNKYRRSDISHYHTIDPQFFLSTFSKKRGRKIGYVHFLPETLEGSLKIPRIFKKIVYKYVIAFYKRMDQLVVVNPSFIPKLTAYGIDPKKVTYIPNFVSKQAFYPVTAEKRRRIRVKLKLKPTDFMIFGDGQVQKRKGVDDFYRLAVNNPHLKFVWAGGFSFGRITAGYSHYEQMIQDAPDNLLFTDIIPRSELNEYLNAADLFLLPSFDELFPMSVLEAFNTQTPVLLRDLDLYQAIIANYYAPATDYEQMNIIINQLAQNPLQLANLASKSKAAADYYSEEHLSEIWREFYEQQANQNEVAHES